jgi:hypothetical protein
MKVTLTMNMPRAMVLPDCATCLICQREGHNYLRLFRLWEPAGGINSES